MAITRKSVQLEDGSILFSQDKPPPRRFYLHTVDAVNPYLFRPDFLPCIHRLGPMRKATPG